ncbi:MAG TPA: ABC transporter permease [Xanthobacteraceae bacterium]|jgi:NitT/TauT family transport system permease protein
MTARRLAAASAALLIVLSLVLPLAAAPAAGVVLRPAALTMTLAAAALFALAGGRSPLASIAFGLAGVVIGAGVTLALLADPDIAGAAAVGFWAMVAATWIAAAACVTRLAGMRPRTKTMRRGLGLAVPLLFGAFLFYLWEVAVRGFGVPAVLMPAPSAITARFAASLPTLGEDFVQTFVRSVLSGYAIGCLSGFLAAVVADRIPFLGRGLLPLGNFAAALPIVGIAPIMVMWFGFDWQSKAAVVAVITFFPMLVNTVTGLAAAGGIECDLMRSYAAGYWQTLFKLKLPGAMPFIFNALKINSTLALIGAIVAEFFGTPIRGMGFRISIEVARMSLDMVWAEIALAAIAGTAFYGLVALAERATTSWHPSYRA